MNRSTTAPPMPYESDPPSREPAHCDACRQMSTTCRFRYPDAADIYCWDCWRNIVLTKHTPLALRVLLSDLYEEYEDSNWRVNEFMWDIYDRLKKSEEELPKKQSEPLFRLKGSSPESS